MGKGAIHHSRAPSYHDLGGGQGTLSRRPRGGAAKVEGICSSTVFDNKILLENSPEYQTRLASLPDAERAALLYGDWNGFSGQVFTEWRNDPDSYHERRGTHVISPFRVPREWKVYRSFDWGYSRPFSVGWYAEDKDGVLYRIRELYGCTGTPNEGVRWNASRVASEIRRIEEEDENLRGRHIGGIADPAIFQKNGGESIGEIMEKHGVYFDRADNSRIAGKMQVHNRLAIDGEGRARLYVFSSCRNFIRTFPCLVYDSTDVEDVDTTGEDHIYDELRYMCMERPIKARRSERESRLILTGGSDPLDLYRTRARFTTR